MRKVIRTANLNVLKTWLIGGQNEYMGSSAEGFHCLTKSDENEHLFENGELSSEKVKEQIQCLIESFGDDPSCDGKGFFYFDDYYRFKIPCEKNLNILKNRVVRDIKEIMDWE